jgi:hypothetical protein
VLGRSSRRQRSGERGQTLILALAFIAFFGLLISSVLSFAGVTALQHTHTEATATKDGLAEGGAAFAAADAVRSGLPCLKSTTAQQLTMQSGDVAKYTVESCYPFNTQQTLGGGGHCLLCVLNQTPVPPGTAAVPGTSVLSATKGITTTGGDDYINGSIADHTQLTANPTSSAHVRVWSGADTSGCVCTPAQVLTYPKPFKDPLPNLAPSPVAGEPVDPEGAPACPTWDPKEGCTASFTDKGSSTIYPGLWDTLTIDGHASVTASPGVYVFTGALQVSGNQDATLTGRGVTIYLACPNYGPAGNACPVSGKGGSIRVSGQGNLSLSAPGSAQYTNVGGSNGTLLGADVVILADPNLVDPGGVDSCTDGDGGCVYDMAGNAATMTGSIDTRGGGVSIEGNGGLAVNNGFLITNSLFVSVTGHVGTGLDLSGPGTFSGPTACNVFDDSVSGNASGSVATGTSPGQGRAIIQSECGNAAANGVVDFNYSP